jgi:hypothetical protein
MENAPFVFDWTHINAMIQWLVAPIIAVLWRHNDRLASTEKELTRLVTIIEQQEIARVELRKLEVETLQRLAAGIEKLDARIDALAKELREVKNGKAA